MLADGRNGMAATTGDDGVDTHQFTLSDDGRYVAFDDPGWELVERWERGLSLTKRPMRAKGGGYWLTDDEWRQVQEVGS